VFRRAHAQRDDLSPRRTRGTSTAELPVYGVPLALPKPGGERLIVNPGSVGQPRDSDPRAAYAIVDTLALTYEPHRVAYPIQKTQERMRKASLPPRLVMRLEYGW
jgi:diadenosine tetraphosphatase ApaH/serine/threonine PP2A family protein phosphatase